MALDPETVCIVGPILIVGFSSALVLGAKASHRLFSGPDSAQRPEDSRPPTSPTRRKIHSPQTPETPGR